jgi:hypothetical protein
MRASHGRHAQRAPKTAIRSMTPTTIAPTRFGDLIVEPTSED